MGINVDQLKEGLRNYSDSLNRHIIRLERDFEDLNNLFFQLEHEYESRTAEEFRSDWRKTTIWFEDYLFQTKDLARILIERIEYSKNL